MPGIALNEDDSHFYFTRAGARLDQAAVASWVDQYAGTQVQELLLCPNAMRTSYDSRVWDPIWLGYDPDGPDDQPLLASTAPETRAIARQWIHTAWQLAQDGLDPYAIWIARARQLGLSPWLSMRMNDLHEVNDERSYLHSEFWRRRPDLRRVPYRTRERRDRAFDYGQAEVRAHHFRLIAELAERYDLDGLELDWMRFGVHFRPGHEAQGAVLLTELTREVRRLLDDWERRRGHRIKLGARVPSRPQSALGLGLDALTWARQGLVDMLVITPFWESCELDMPVEIWQALLQGTGVTLAAGLEINVRPDPHTLQQPHSLQTARAAAITLLDRGADRIYLFNFMDDPSGEVPLLGRDYPALLRELGSVDTLVGKPRRHVLTFADTWAVGEPPALPLPARCSGGWWHAFRIPLGPAPTSDRLLVGLGLTAGSAEGLEVWLNGQPCTYAGTPPVEPPCPEVPLHAWSAPAAAAVRGYNVIELMPACDLTVGWVEIAVAP
jgi:hypothetical protein